jgi:hypothetical protein
VVWKGEERRGVGLKERRRKEKEKKERDFGQTSLFISPFMSRPAVVDAPAKPSLRGAKRTIIDWPVVSWFCAISGSPSKFVTCFGQSQMKWARFSRCPFATPGGRKGRGKRYMSCTVQGMARIAQKNNTRENNNTTFKEKQIISCINIRLTALSALSSCLEALTKGGERQRCCGKTVKGTRRRV